MSKEKQIVEEMKKDLCECHTIDEWAAREYGEAYTDFDATAEKMLDRGWIKQSEGEWKRTDAYPHRIYCSLCYRTYVMNEEIIAGRLEYPTFSFCTEAEYCPHCGAKMKGESK